MSRPVLIRNLLILASLGLLALSGCEGFFLKPLVADFTATPTSGVAPLTVRFTDLSQGAPTKPILHWRWEFGDGTMAEEQNPEHTYTVPGSYTVTLRVIDAAGRSAEATKEDYIVVEPSTPAPPGPSFPPSRGFAEAKVTLLEFTDFTCPSCAQFASWTLPEIEEDYVNPGKVRLVFRAFPAHSSQAWLAAEAAYCAHEQGKFWAYHDELFRLELTRGSRAFTPEKLEELAAELGLDVQEFSRCLEEHRYAYAIDADLAEARRLGVETTPTFFVNDREIVGAQHYEEFRKAIEAELAE